MHLKPFIYYRPASLREVFEIIQTCTPGQFTFMGGGTDILLKIKQRLISPIKIISLRGVPELKKIERQGRFISIGALASLRQIKESACIQQFFPALVQATGRIGSPQLRNMGTIGGNVCLDTRCVYYNQQSWEGAFEPCFKRGGKRCHVVKKGKRCYALFCADTPAVLLALGARLHIAGPAGQREVPIAEFYQDDGLCCHRLHADELLMNITIPIEQNRVSLYSRFSMRGAIDFPMVGVAVTLQGSDNGHLINPKIAATGLQSKPLRLHTLEQLLAGKDTTMGEMEKLIKEGIKEIVIARSKGVSSNYRRNLLKFLIERALGESILKAGKMK